MQGGILPSSIENTEAKEYTYCTMSYSYRYSQWNWKLILRT